MGAPYGRQRDVTTPDWDLRERGEGIGQREIRELKILGLGYWLGQRGKRSVQAWLGYHQNCKHSRGGGLRGPQGTRFIGSIGHVGLELRREGPAGWALAALSL